MDHGGGIDDEITGETTVFICPEAELNKKKKTKKVEAALAAEIPVLSVEWVQNLCNREEEGIKLRDNKTAAKYLVGDSTMPENKRICIKYSKERIEKEKAKQEAEEKKQKEAEEAKNKKKRKRPIPKAGSDVLKVDSSSGHDHDCEILVTQDDVAGYVAWNSMLNVSDISTGVNKFYRMQVLKSKGKKKYYFFIKWGRVGVESVGDNRVYDHGTSESSATAAFEEKFKEMTGQPWEDKDLFEKKPGKYFMVSLDDGNEDEEDHEELKKISKRARKEDKDESNENNSNNMQIDKNARLPKRVQDLVSLIFDKEMMKKQLAAMNVDIKKMPLGKISKAQIRNGYNALTDIQNLLETPNPSKAKLADATNRFYTLIPHDFGTADPPLINDVELVKKKIDMLDALADIEIANQLMKDDQRSTEEEALEKHYAALKSEINPVEKGSELYKLLESYAYNSHDKDYFSRFSFEVEDIFDITRQGEPERYKDWEKNENRMLLWHGSRLTNWVGIISQGLRIAPPEAPKTGYRFGKGVYFADVISKSGSYCFTTNQNPHAVMLLAEVALGNPNELLKDEYMEKAPPGKHCTKALGMAAPDPKGDQKALDSVKVPAGKVIKTGVKSACSHNEYIIYDVAQIRIRYLLRLKFKHDY
jgi:poly [ADP-ribose] polymerase